MNYWILMLSFCLARGQSFYSATVFVSDTLINTETTYDFTVVFSVLENISIPPRFKLTLTFPTEIGIVSAAGSVPSTCIIQDADNVKPDISIVTMYDPANPSIGQTDSDLDGQCGVETSTSIVIVIPDDRNNILKFSLGLLRNPYAVLNAHGPIQFDGTDESGTMNYSGTFTFPSSTFTEGALTLVSFESSDKKVGATSAYTFEISPQHEIPASGKVEFTFSSSFSLSSPSSEGKIGSGSLVSLSTDQSDNSVTVSGLFTTSSSSIFSITISGVVNPNSVHTSDVTIRTMTSLNELIDTMVTTDPGATEPCEIQSVNFFTTTDTVLLENSFTFYLNTNSRIPEEGKVEMIIPSTLTLTSSLTCSSSVGLTGSLICFASGNTVTSSTISQNDDLIIITYTNIINPPDTVQTGHFGFSTYTSDNRLVCQNSQLRTYSATPGAITATSLTRTPVVVGSSAVYSVEFTISTQFVGNIKLEIPADQMLEDTGIICRNGGNDLNCSKTGSSSSVYELQMQEWCNESSCGGCCPADSVLTIDISGVKNQLFTGDTITSSVEIYTMNAGMTGIIDQITSGLQFGPSLTTASIVDAGVSRTVNTVGEATSLVFTHTSVVEYQANSQFLYTFPEFLVYGTPTCKYAGVTKTCAPVFYSDNSLQSLTVSDVCGCSQGQAIEIVLEGLENPLTTQSVSGDFTLAISTSEGYDIENGSVSSSIGALTRGEITSFTFVRSDDMIKTSISVEYSFTIATELSAGATILMNFPDEVLVVDGTVEVFKESTKLNPVITNNGESVQTIEINDYCPCNENSIVKLTITGLKTLDQVKLITGTLSVLTKTGTYEVDYGQTEASSLLASLTAGQLYGIYIHPYNPTTSAVTNYKIIFTSEHTIPADSIIEISFPPEIDANSLASCGSYIGISSSLQCSVSSNIVTVTDGFPFALDGSVMIGLWLNSITNGGSAGVTSAFVIKILTSASEEINVDPAGVTSLYSPTGTCSCQSCAGSDTTCYECVNPGPQPILKDYSCVVECPSTHFLITSDYSCVQCHHTCASCLGPLNSECIDCAPGHVKSDGYCLDACPTGTTESSGVCVNDNPCISPCTQCSTSLDYCLTCDSTTIYEEEGNCGTDVCPDGYFDLSQKCTKCNNNCATCSGTSTNCLTCPELFAQPYLNQVDATCVDSCPENITVLVSKTCELCHDSCATCDGVLSTDCVTCPSTGTKYFTSASECVDECPNGTYHFDNPDSFSCISTCDDGFFVEEATRYCKPCLSTCQTCENDSVCLTCDLAGITPFYTSESLCVSSCPSSYYEYTLDSRKECYQTECPSGSLRFTDTNSFKSCILPSSCPSTGYFITADNKDCSLCDPTCLTCDTSKCLSCDQSGVYPYITDAGECVSDCSSTQYKLDFNCYDECPSSHLHYIVSASSRICITDCYDKHFIDPATRFCSPCYISCETCDGSSNQNCLSCTTSFPLFTENNECVTECYSNEYQSTTADRCYLTCPTGTYHFIDAEQNDKKVCATTCGDGFYDTVENDDTFCYKCSSSCLTCDGGTSNDCLTCTSELFYDSVEKTCASACGDKYQYELGATKQCLSTCPDGTLHYDNPGGWKECIDSCLGSNYIDEDDDYCRPCYPTCTTCLDGLATDCVTCTGSYPFLMETGECATECLPTDYVFTQDSVQKCFAVCPSGSYGLDLVSTRTCESDCPDGYYISNTVCATCFSTCETCTGGGATQCSTCVSPYSLYENQCLDVCPEGFTGVNNVCVLTCTQENCEECADGNIQQCINCKNSFYLLNGACVTACPSGYFVSSGICSPCSNTCTTCSGSTSNECTSCSDPYIFYESQCVTECPEGLVARNGRCQAPCEPPCAECQDGTTDVCIDCEGTYYILFNNTCINHCPIGYFYDSSSCQNCDSACSTCLDLTGCVSCASSSQYLTDNQTCTDSCPLGYTNNNSTMTCDLEIIPPSEDSSEEYVEMYVVYWLGGEVALIVAVGVLSKVICGGGLVSTLMCLMSVAEFSVRLAFCCFLWTEDAYGAKVLSSMGISLLAGRSFIALLFIFIHLSDLLMQSATFAEFYKELKFSVFTVLVMSVFFGLNFLRIFYIGLFGLKVSSYVKSIATVSGFRFPLEKLCYYCIMLVNIPHFVLEVLVLTSYDMESNSWQISTLSLSLNATMSIIYLIVYYLGPWK